MDMAKVEKRRAQGESLRLIASDLGVSATLQLRGYLTRDGFWNAKRFLGLASPDKRHFCRHYGEEEDICVQRQTRHVHDRTCNLLWVHGRFNLH